MSRFDVIRAWKDKAFRQNLSDADRARLPDNPAGSVELTETEAAAVVGQLANVCCTGACHSQSVMSV
jgi:mersacidin/lichenicidin family type 2 lantibiotic